ncbi:MAG: aminoglycoside phosphotransferase family protein, partial [Acidimicrobiales bacterium]
VSDWPRRIDSRTLGCITSVLSKISAIPASTGLNDLSVIGSGKPLWGNAKEGWNETIVSFAERRSDQFADLWRRDVSDFDIRRDALFSRVLDLPEIELRLVHGDICPENILVDEQLRPVALVDFGFLTFVGDPLFDAAVTSCITDMWGPYAQAHETQICAELSIQMPGFSDRAELYKGLYGLITSNAYDPTGNDAQYEFCVNLMRRAQMTEFLGL